VHGSWEILFSVIVFDMFVDQLLYPIFAEKRSFFMNSISTKIARNGSCLSNSGKLQLGLTYDLGFRGSVNGYLRSAQYCIP
jgi:hypothetical protein